MHLAVEMHGLSPAAQEVTETPTWFQGPGWDGGGNAAPLALAAIANATTMTAAQHG